LDTLVELLFFRSLFTPENNKSHLGLNQFQKTRVEDCLGDGNISPPVEKVAAGSWASFRLGD